MSIKVKISKRGQQYELQQKENYNPFGNLSLCPKSIIALAQSSYDSQLIEFTLNQLKTPCNLKHETHLLRMRQIADKQETFVYGQMNINSQIETQVQYSDHSFYDQMDTSHRKNSLHYFDESHQHF
ncbi:unnamed protein product (macronuclear) [Paramecium tetraurelia]|uniref:Uncharacterized protein n=1 Tax=Paramecium tetraurelia TaxID=5888 RepID=A0CIS8_PARTE|nr:uncharacterized protein GSPATT00007830001 [Paramecium tetraurelia]CAK70695.1 unnamed protein product [Paramecium tetraurelia]|eukprot:XP_001438092.1 hypothetical protein (macronuclear) [Paramecium tetraurelia strain d4-2]